MNPEWKAVTTQGNFNVAAAPATQRSVINGMHIGSAVNERIGSKVSIRSIELRAQVTAPQSSSTVNAWTGAIVRLSIVVDKMSNGTVPTDAMIWTDQINYDPNCCVALRNLDNRHRFKLLYDKTFNVSYYGQYGDHITKHVYMKLKKPLLVSFNSGDTGGVSDMESGALYFWFHESNNSSVLGASDCTWVSRVRYTDN